jgi:hypothetical protein
MGLDAADIAGVLAFVAVLCLCDKFLEGRIPNGSDMLAGTAASRWILSTGYQITVMAPLGVNALLNAPPQGFMDAPAAQHAIFSRAVIYLMFAMEARDLPHLKWADNKVLLIHHVFVMISCCASLAAIEEGFGVFVMGVMVLEVGSVTFNLYVIQPKWREFVAAYVVVMTLSNISAIAITIYGATFPLGNVTRVFFVACGIIFSIGRQEHLWREPIRKNWAEGRSIFDFAASKKAA